MSHFLLNAEDASGLENFEGVTADNYEKIGGLYLNGRRFFDEARTIQRRLTSLRAFGKFQRISHPLCDYVAPSPPASRPHPLPEGMDGVLAMLSFAESEYEQAIVTLCGMTGARISEALSVTVKDVNLKEKIIILGGKHSRWREVPLSKMALQYLVPAVVLAYDAADKRLVPRSDRWGRDLVKTLAGFAELDDETASHYLRATFATWLYNKTKDLRLVQTALGHARSTTTEIYTGVNFQALRGAIELN